MTFVAKSKPSDITEMCTLSATSVESIHSEQSSESRSPVATKAAFQSVIQCSYNALKARYIHTPTLECPATPATRVSSDSGSTRDEAASTDFSDAESCNRSTSCDADVLSVDGSASDSESASVRAYPSIGTASDEEAAVSAIRAAADRSEDEKVARAARSILNKLTVEKFDALHEKLATTCGVRTPAQMALLMREIFEKATEQHHFSAMYADLCVRLEADERLSGAMAAEGEPNSFRRLLLGQCQSAFEKLFEPDEVAADASQDPEVLQELAMRRKRRALGNVKLVGHLLVRGMLNSRLLVECSDALLASRSSCPEALEALSVLLTVTGPKFDQKEWRGQERFHGVFKVCEELTKDKAVPPRVRFLLRDVLDLRKAGWQQPGRATAEPKGPMRLEEVKRQAELGVQDGAAAAGRRPLPLKRRSAPAEAKAAWLTEARRTRPASPSPVAAALPEPAPEPAAAAAAPPAPVSPKAFSLKDFHRDLASTLRDLGADMNVVTAVRRVRAQNVPPSYHTSEFVDIITRASEEKRGPARRMMFTFAAGLMSSEGSAFERSRCIEGVGVFFREVYEELCSEVPRLQQIVLAELLPALKSVAAAEDLKQAVPEELHAGLA